MPTFLQRKDLIDPAFEVFCFLRGRKDGMIPSLRPEFDLAKDNTRVICRIQHHVPEHLRQYMLAAGACNEISARGDHLQSAKVDLLVSSDRVIDHGLCFGKSRRIKDDHVILFACSALLSQQVERICLHKMNPVFQVVQDGVFLCKAAGKTADVKRMSIV